MGFESMNGKLCKKNKKKKQEEKIKKTVENIWKEEERFRSSVGSSKY